MKNFSPIWVLMALCYSSAFGQGVYPVRDYLAKTYYTEIETSPEARHVAVLGRKSNYAADRIDWNIWLIKGGAQRESRPVSIASTGDELAALSWSPDGRYLASGLSQSIPRNRESLSGEVPDCGQYYGFIRMI